MKPGIASKRSVESGRQTAIREFGMYVTCENSDDIAYIVREAGEDCLVIGTDYGHTDTSSDVDAIKVFRDRADPFCRRQTKDFERQRARSVRALEYEFAMS